MTRSMGQLIIFLAGALVLGLILRIELDEKLKQVIIWAYALGGAGIIFIYPEVKEYLRLRKLKALRKTTKNSFELDWKWVPSDILLEIKHLVPKFNFKVDKESDPIGGKAYFKGDICGQKVEIKVSQNNPFEFIKHINPLIAQLSGRKFEELPADGDYYLFILIPENQR